MLLLKRILISLYKRLEAILPSLVCCVFHIVEDAWPGLCYGWVLVGGALRQVSEICKRYVTQQGSVGTQMGLGFNICAAPTLMFYPCISDGGTNGSSEREGDEGEMGLSYDTW